VPAASPSERLLRRLRPPSRSGAPAGHREEINEKNHRLHREIAAATARRETFSSTIDGEKVPYSDADRNFHRLHGPDRIDHHRLHSRGGAGAAGASRRGTGIERAEF
jgi:hypothetical protein